MGGKLDRRQDSPTLLAGEGFPDFVTPSSERRLSAGGCLVVRGP